MKVDPRFTDETSIVPPTPGAALVRLSQTIGAVRRLPNAETVPSLVQNLASARERLQEAIENGDKLGTPFQNAQNALRELYAHVIEMGADADENATILIALGFPDPRISEPEYVGAVNVNTVVTTHFKPVRQVFSTLTFQEAPGATAYWLFEIRALGRDGDGGEATDALVENYAPYFSRVRLPVGPHRFIIESRNPSKSARSEEFSIEVPAL